jgi:hypothetical protein
VYFSGIPRKVRIRHDLHYVSRVSRLP